MHILHSFSTFVKVLKGEFVQKSRTSLVVDRFLYSHDLNVLFRGGSCREKLVTSHS